MAERDEKGRFIPGNKASPGRLPKEREERYYEILLSTVTYEEFKAIVNRAKEQAIKGDAVARKWLADYLVGAAIQRTEITGAGGEPLKIVYVNDWRTEA